MSGSTVPAPPGVSLRTVLASIAGLWTCYFVLVTIRAWIGLELQGELLWRRALVCLAGMAITFVLWLILRLADRRSLGFQIGLALVLAIPASLAIAKLNIFAFAEVQETVESKIAERRGYSIRRDASGNIVIEAPAVPGPDVDGPLGPDNAGRAKVVLPTESDAGRQWLPVLELAIGRYFLLLSWAALYLALSAVGRAREAERREARFRSAARAAELRSLRYQVNPHFLFNAFNSLSALVMTGKGERAEEMIQRLSSFYRHSLAEDPTGDVELADEIALQRDYLAIEAVRFPKRLKTVIELPEELAHLHVPGMILQPLVENSVKYAVAPVARPVTIVISAREEYGRLVLTVADDGPGGAEVGSPGFGIGLANVRDRIEARFGPDATLVSGPFEGGYRSELRLPMVQDD
ncbi:histidine kinase [Tsuneonella sp. YG55]|uniref:Histidine kinase n=1 Tax=Tsuneonella litorea TaxID=2976475 RepID=A0A9X2VZJ3_9SPHN|nr:histidine kinase [Tsuneonella litorea]MCT2557893.1 histidine kinase [Tsuneonella litorea]